MQTEQEIKLSTVELPSSDQDRKIIKDAIQEMIDSMTRKDAETELQTEICKSVKEETGFDPKHLRKIAKMQYKNNADEVSSEIEDLVSVLDILNKSNISTEDS